MQTFDEILTALQQEHPTLTEVINGEVVELSEEKRQETLQAWAQSIFDAAKQPKNWPDVQSFVEEFSLQELGQIELSQVPEVAQLRFKLHTWRGGVVASHPLVIAGRTVLVTAGIITTERADQIFGPIPA
jgi:hypothetical protein